MSQTNLWCIFLKLLKPITSSNESLSLSEAALLAGDFVPTLLAKAGWRETRLCLSTLCMDFKQHSTDECSEAESETKKGGNLAEPGLYNQ